MTIVTTEAELNAAIDAANADLSGSALTITFGDGFTGSDGLTEALHAIALQGATTLTIDGAGATIDGGGAYPGLTVTSGAATIENLAIADVGETTVAAGATLALSGGSVSIASSGGVQVDGVLDLSGYQGFSDAIQNLSGSGEVDLGRFVQTTSGGGGYVVGGASLTLHETSSTTFSGVIADGGADTGITINGGGALSLTGAFTYTGQTNLQNTTMQLVGDGSVAAQSSFVDNGTLDVSGSTTAHDGVFGATVQNLYGFGALLLGATTLTLEENAGSTFNGVIQDGATAGGSLVVSNTAAGAGSLTLTGAETYTGSTAVLAGATLALGGESSIFASSGVRVDGVLDLSGYQGGGDAIHHLSGSGAVMLGQVVNGNDTGDASLLINEATSTVFSGTISDGGSGGLIVAGAGTLTLSGANTYHGSTQLSGGTLEVTDGAIDETSAVTGSGTLIFDYAQDAVFAPTVGGGITVENVGPGHVTLANVVYDPGTAPSQPVTVEAGSTVSFQSADAAHPLVIDQPITGAGTVAIDAGSGVVELAFASPGFTGVTTLSAGTLEIGDAQALGSGSLALAQGTAIAYAPGVSEVSNTIAISGDPDFDVATGQTTTQSGAITDGDDGNGNAVPGDLVKTGGGELILTADNSYSGSTTVQAGVLALAGAGAIADSSSVAIAAGATFDISGATAGATIHDLADTAPLVVGGAVSSAVVNLGAQTLTLIEGDGAFSGVIAGSGGLELQSGTLTLVGDSTYTGATTIDAGATLSLGYGGTTGSVASASIVDNGVLDFEQGYGPVVAASTVAGVISGSGAVSMSVTGSVTLTAAETYTGATAINGGALALHGAGSIASSQAVSIGRYGVLDISGSGADQTVNSLSGQGANSVGGQVHLGAHTLTVNTGVGGSTTFGGVIDSDATGGGGLTVENVTAQGAAGSAGARLTLDTPQTYTGATTIEAGATLALTQTNSGPPLFMYSTGSIAASSGLDLAGDGATFDLSGLGYYTAATVQSLSGVAGSHITAFNGKGYTEVLTVSGSTSTVFAGTIEGSILLEMNGSDADTTLTLTGANASTRIAQIDAGVLALAEGGSFASGAYIESSGALDISQTTAGATLSRLDGDGAVHLGAQHLTVGADSFYGVIADGGIAGGVGGSLEVTSSFTVYGANTYTGATTIDVGATLTLGLGESGTAGSIDHTSAVVDNGTLAFDLSADETFTAPISGSGGIVQGGSGVLTLSGANTFTGGVVIDSGEFHMTSAAGAGSTLNGGGVISFENGGGHPAVLAIDAAAFDGAGHLANTIANFGSGAPQAIDLGGLHFTASETVAVTGGTGGTNTLTVANGTAMDTLTLSGGATTAANLVLGDDGHGGTLIYTSLADAIMVANSLTSGNVSIVLPGDETLSSGALPAISLHPGVTLTIDGAGHTLDGADQYQGLFVYSGAVTIEHLTIADAVATGGAGQASTGGAGGGGGGGAGLGGGVFVANDPNAGAPGQATLIDVSFVHDGAAGGAGGAGGSGTNYSSGGRGGALGFVGMQNTDYGHGGYSSGGGGGALGGGGGGGYSVDSGSTGAGGVGGDGAFGGGGGGGGVGRSGQPDGAGGASGFGAGAAGQTGAGAGGAGGGGLGAGGDIFVQAGATLVIQGGSAQAGTVAGGLGGAPDGGVGSAYGSALFIQGDQSVTLEAAAGGTAVVSGVIADQTGSGGVDANAGAGGVVIGDHSGAFTGAVQLSAVNTFTGGVTIDSGVLELGVTGAAGSGAIHFDGVGALQIDAGVTVANTITGLAGGDAFVFTGETVASATIDANNVLTVVESDGTKTLQLDPAQSFGGAALRLGQQGGNGLVTLVTAAAITGAAAAQAATDAAPVHPFAQVVVTDASSSDSATITLTDASGLATDADGVLSGAGLTKAGVGTYVLASAPAATLTAELQALTFTPTAHQVAPGAAVTTGFSLSVGDGQLSPTVDATTSVVVTAADSLPTTMDQAASVAQRAVVTGNALAGDASLDHGAVLTVATAASGAVGAQAVTAGGVAVQGGHGVLTIHADGSYSYAATGEGEAVGQTYADAFTLTVGDGHGATTAETLTITVTGSATGDTNANLIYGGTGAPETITGLGGADALVAGAAADTFAYTAASDSPFSATAGGYDVIQGFRTGVDHIDVSAADGGAVRLVGMDDHTYLYFGPDGHGGYSGEIDVQGVVAPGDVIASAGASVLQGLGQVVTGDAANNYTAIFDFGSNLASYEHTAAGLVVTGPDGSETLVGVEHLQFADIRLGVDAIPADGPPVTPEAGQVITGGDAGATLTGGSGPDTIVGGTGNDVIAGGAGSDLLTGGGGADTAVYAGRSLFYQVDLGLDSSGHAHGTVAGGDEGGVDTLSGITDVRFLDGTLTTNPDSTAAEIYRLYDTLLNRAPEQGGLDAYQQFLASGHTLAQAAQFAFGSAEVQADTAHLSNADFVTYLYENAAGREPDAYGLQQYTALLESGTSRVDVALNISESAEHRGDTEGGLAAGLWEPDVKASGLALLYDVAVQREPDAFGLAAYTAELDAGATFRQLANQAYASPESQALYGDLDDKAFVDALYDHAVHRLPDSFGEQAYVNELQNGSTRGDVVWQVAISAEHQDLVLSHPDTSFFVF